MISWGVKWGALNEKHQCVSNAIKAYAHNKNKGPLVYDVSQKICYHCFS